MSIANKIQLAQDKVLEIFQLLEEQGVDISNQNSLTQLKQAVQDYIDTHSGQINFTALDYITSNGNQYIDTQIPITNTMAVELEFAVTNWTNGKSLGGNYIDGNEFNILKNNDGSLYSNISLSSVYNIASQDNDRHVLLYNTFGNDILYDNDYKMYVMNIQGQEASPSLLLLTNSENEQKINARIYMCKIFSNVTGEILRYFIPVLDENNVACLFDLVSKEFYYSLGSEDFSF